MCQENETQTVSRMVVDFGSPKFIVLFFSLFHSGAKNVFPLMDDICDNIIIQHSCHR